MIVKEQLNQRNTKKTSTSAAKDYIGFAIGFVLIMLSTFSDLNKKGESNSTITVQEQTIPVDQTAFLKSISNLTIEGL